MHKGKYLAREPENKHELTKKRHLLLEQSYIHDVSLDI